MPDQSISNHKIFAAFNRLLLKNIENDDHQFFVVGLPMPLKEEIDVAYGCGLFKRKKFIDIDNESIRDQLLHYFPRGNKEIFAHADQQGIASIIDNWTIAHPGKNNFSVPPIYSIKATQPKGAYHSRLSNDKSYLLYQIPSTDINITCACIPFMPQLIKIDLTLNPPSSII